MIDLYDILTLDDDKEYFVCGKIDYKAKTFVYLVGKEDHKNILFGYLDNGDIMEIEDKELINELIPLFNKQAKENLEKIKKDMQ